MNINADLFLGLSANNILLFNAEYAKWKDSFLKGKDLTLANQLNTLLDPVFEQYKNLLETDLEVLYKKTIETTKEWNKCYVIESQKVVASTAKIFLSKIEENKNHFFGTPFNQDLKVDINQEIQKLTTPVIRQFTDFWEKVVSDFLEESNNIFVSITYNFSTERKRILLEIFEHV